MPVCVVLVELAITCIHDYMVVTVTVNKIYGKINFNRWALAITAVPTTLTSRFPTTGYARVLLLIMYRARARRNGYRVFITVYILSWGRLDLAVLFTPSTPTRQNRNQVHWNICAGVRRSTPSFEVV